MGVIVWLVELLCRVKYVVVLIGVGVFIVVGIFDFCGFKGFYVMGKYLFDWVFSIDCFL